MKAVFHALPTLDGVHVLVMNQTAVVLLLNALDPNTDGEPAKRIRAALHGQLEAAWCGPADAPAPGEKPFAIELPGIQKRS